MWGYTGSVERRSSSSNHLSTENSFISALFDPMGMVCVVSLVSNDPGRLLLKVTEGVLFHREIERPVSPTLPYYKVFVIQQPAGPGTVKKPNAAAKALEN